MGCHEGWFSGGNCLHHLSEATEECCWGKVLLLFGGGVGRLSLCSRVLLLPPWHRFHAAGCVGDLKEEKREGGGFWHDAMV